MRQIELRLALVLYGGVSLAVYMHGVTRELLNLQRASKALEEARAKGVPLDGAGAELRGSTASYYHILRTLHPDLDLRVVIDAISGASAGGINGIMLARAIAHDLPLDSHRSFWLEKADVTQLCGKPRGVTRLAKRVLAPFIGRILGLVLEQDPDNPEARRKLHWFMSSRWFEPPFSGARFARWMLEACNAMDLEDRGDTLIPLGQKLELFVTLTDYFGVKRTVPLSAHSSTHEIEHRRLLKFLARNDGIDGIKSQLVADCAPSHVFAARATASFPGAFPPASVEEMDRVVKSLNADWSHRDQFVEQELMGPLENGAPRLFIDGSVVMNKPFQPVIESISERAASREVVRRLLYVDPTPGDTGEPEEQDYAAPGFFRSILAALAHIPRNEPIGDDLKEIDEMNRNIRRLKDVIAAAKPHVDREVDVILQLPGEGTTPAEALGWARAEATRMAKEHAGFSYAGYEQLRLNLLSHRLAKLIKRLGGHDGVGEATHHLERAILRHLTMEGDASGMVGGDEPAVSIVHLDIDYRVRRLRSVIRKLNLIFGSEQLDAACVQRMGVLKERLYELITYLQYRWSRAFYGTETGEACEALHLLLSEPSKLDRALRLLQKRMGLADLDLLIDEVVSDADEELAASLSSHPIKRAYIGFAFYDAVTLPIQHTSDHSELGEVTVSRISPKDAVALNEHGSVLKGAQLQSFGAFFNRSWREHDYLWGRLNAAERLVALLRGVDRDGGGVSGLDAHLELLFESILEEEAPHLTANADLISGIYASMARAAKHREGASQSPETAEP
ncbi:patatin-like protein [Pseudovibrio exalbescens]|uniref:patatin-like protein n=1 Tax=Pseudovibrio exalbescens TaxID=197461 RepID=UPI002365EAA4|nr:patatin-like protein [Pseudovibrio exalbescens]MDD7910646.1 patatin-like protein [Pseudovibrio exalbescens]